jgi:hypothetical protein
MGWSASTRTPALTRETEELGLDDVVDELRRNARAIAEAIGIPTRCADVHGRSPRRQCDRASRDSPGQLRKPS